ELKAVYYAEQIRGIKEEMEEDVRMAAELQKSFFPNTYPCFPATAGSDGSCVGFFHHYHASGMVSGDFCTVRRLSETESGIFLCDVMGHGVRAALVTALICAMVEEITGQAKDPGDFLGRMNDLLIPILRQEDMFLYATACYATFDARTGRLRIANAGHPVPLHFQGSEKTVRWLLDAGSTRGPALAITEGAGFQTLEMQLMPGDSVVMYTDGLYEVEGASGEEFGEHRLLAAAQRRVGLPLEQLFPVLVNEACLYAGDGALDDDVCLVGLHFNKPMA
ncbi:MAG: PP2C family protein-serine/threonine phosphatase, partial [Verrucomicrobiota bacterium]|nr:PP2C family protein-serine/threonine phosphatase [Verrucomicrobiota bacterium]